MLIRVLILLLPAIDYRDSDESFNQEFWVHTSMQKMKVFERRVRKFDEGKKSEKLSQILLLYTILGLRK